MKTRCDRLTAAGVLILGLTFYWSTSYPSITWWDASVYSTAAACLGVTHAPGSLLLTLCGWPLSALASQNPARLLNLFAGFIASLTIVLALGNARKIRSLLSERGEEGSNDLENVLLFVASGIVICSATLWEHAIMFTPYILTALFTILILAALLRWWENGDRADSWKSLFTITLLLGLDFSVHRTNAVLIPGILLVMLFKAPRIFLRVRSYVAACGGMLLGLSLQLLYIPLSLNDPPLNLGETNDLTRWWDFVSLSQYGGSFLLNVWERNAPLWSYQVPYYFNGFAENFFHKSQSTLILGYAPALLGLVGMVHLFALNRKLGPALSLLFVATIASSIIYFNVPENFFRSLHRHYLPTYVIFAVFIFTGVLLVARRLAGLSRVMRRITFAGVCVLLLAIVGAQYSANIARCSCSGSTFAVDHAANVIESVGPMGIVFSNGDNNYFPELYLQIAEGKRPDIVYCNLSLLNLGWYLAQIERRHPEFPVSGKGTGESVLVHDNWKTEHAAIPIDEAVRKEYSLKKDTVHVMLPAIRGERWILQQDLVVFDVIATNKWRRPVYFVKDGLEPELYGWLKAYLSDEGLVYRLVPDSSNMLNVRAMEGVLARAKLGGYNDRSLSLDDVTIRVGNQYYGMFLAVAREKIQAGDVEGGSAYLDQMTRWLPLERLRPDEKVVGELKGLRMALEHRAMP